MSLRSLALDQLEFKRSLDRTNEISHIFILPVLLRSPTDSLATQSAAWESQIAEANTQIIERQREIDDIAFSLYGIDNEDRYAIEASLNSALTPKDEAYSEVTDDDLEDAADSPADTVSLVAALVSYAVGCAFGRWDVRYAIGALPTPTLPDPFAPLPVYSLGRLTGEDGLPTRVPQPGYPLRFDADGILTDDPDDDDDIVRRVRNFLDLVFGERAEAIEREACQILGVRDLRDYFRKPGAGGFWADHIRRYSKSRRKAPIYWLLQSPKRGYGLWLYYHRLDSDILYKAQVNYVEPKLRQVGERLDELRVRRAGAATPRDARQADRAIEQQEGLLADIGEFRDRLKRAADLGLAPDLNDGVVLTIAPLRELVPWSEAKRYWQELLAGKHEWSSIGQQLRAKGLVT